MLTQPESEPVRTKILYKPNETNFDISKKLRFYWTKPKSDWDPVIGCAINWGCSLIKKNIMIFFCQPKTIMINIIRLG